MLLSHGGISSGTVSATSMPCCTNASRLRGLFDIRLAEQADAPAFMPSEVDDDAAALRDDRAQRGGELVAALAVLGTEGVTGQALGMQAGQDVLPPPLTLEQG